MPPLFPRIIDKGLSLAQESKFALQKFSPTYKDNLRWIKSLGYDISGVDKEAFKGAFDLRQQALKLPEDAYHSILTGTFGYTPETPSHNTDFKLQTYAPQQRYGSIGRLDIVPYNYTSKGMYMPEMIEKDAGSSFTKLGINDPYTAIGMESGRQLTDILGGKFVSGSYLLQPKKTVGHISNYFRTTPLVDSNGYPIPGNYSEEDSIENYIRNYYTRHRRFPSYDEISNMEKIVNSAYKDSMAASEHGDYVTSSLPQFFDESGNIRSELLDDDALMYDLEKIRHYGVPGFYVRTLDELRRPTDLKVDFLHPFIHPETLFEDYQIIKNPNLGIFSKKLGGILKRI